jgi:hypothetical protein
VSGQTECVRTRLLTEKAHLLPLAAEPFDLTEISTAGQPDVCEGGAERQLRPLKRGLVVEAQVASTTIEVWQQQPDR